MKKVIISLLCASSIASANISMVSAGISSTTAYLSESEKIDILLDDISKLEQIIETKKMEIQKLAVGEKKDTVEWEDFDIDISADFLGTPTHVKIVRMGLDYTNSSPELVVIYYTKIISSEKFSPSIAIDGSLQYETDQALDWASVSDYNTYLIKDGDNFIEGDKYSLPAKVAPGWEGYFSRRFILDVPNAEYYLVDGFLNGNNWKIAIAGTEEEFGELVTPGD